MSNAELTKRMKNKDDKKALLALCKWFAAYVEARGGRPRIGIGSPVWGQHPVRCAVNGTVLASFTSYEAASLATALADRSIEKRVKELACDSI